MSETQQPRVLCVDDEPIVLEILSHQLRREFAVTTAPDAQKALELISTEKPFAVVLADMRMPGVNGIVLLKRLRQITPDTVRVLLTGQGDVDAVASAVNEAQVHRFLTKPCTGEALISAVRSAAEQHRINTEERAVIDRTLQGALKMLSDVLQLTSPTIHARVGRIQNLIKDLSAQLGVAESWPIEVAGMLSQLGADADAGQARAQQNEHEREALRKLRSIAGQLMSAVPRMETIQGILSAQRGAGVRPKVAAGDATSTPALILRMAIDYDSYEVMGVPAQAVLEMMRCRADVYDASMLAGLAAVRVKAKAQLAVKELPLSAIEPGMIFADDVVLKTGLVLVNRGFEVTERFIERARSFTGGRVREPVKVLIPKTPGSAAAA